MTNGTVFPPCYLPGPNCGGGNEDSGDPLQKVPCMHCYIQCPQPCSRPPSTHASAGDSWTLTGKSGSVSCGVTAHSPGSWCAQSWAKANRVLPRVCVSHNKYPLLTTKEKTLHVDITRWSTPKSDWLYSIQPKVEKFYIVSKNKTGSWLQHRPWTPYCQIQT